MDFTLNYSPIGSLIDVQVHHFNSILDVKTFITNIVFPLKKQNNKVYLLALEDEIIVTEEGLFIDEIFWEDSYSWINPYDFSEAALYEFESYQEAYECALLLKETSHLCYKKQHYGQSNT